MLLVNGKYYGGMYRILWELHRELPQPTPALEFSLTQGHLQRCGFICLISSAIYCLLQTLDLFLIMTKKRDASIGSGTVERNKGRESLWVFKCTF